MRLFKLIMIGLFSLVGSLSFAGTEVFTGILTNHTQQVIKTIDYELCTLNVENPKCIPGGELQVAIPVGGYYRLESSQVAVPAHEKDQRFSFNITAVNNPKGPNPYGVNCFSATTTADTSEQSEVILSQFPHGIICSSY